MYDMLLCYNGNDSLKRILRRSKAEEELTTDNAGVGESCERPDSRKAGGDYYVSREEVDKWAKEMMQAMLPDGDGVRFFPLDSKNKGLISFVVLGLGGRLQRRPRGQY